MDNRHSLPDYISFDPFTENTFTEHTQQIEELFHLEEGSLSETLSDDKWQHELSETLSSYANQQIDLEQERASASTTPYDADDQDTRAYLQKQQTVLQQYIDGIDQHLQTRKAGILQACTTEFSHAKSRFFSDDGSAAGNHAAALHVLKQNIGIAVMQAANSIAQTWKDDVQKNASKFNLIFFEFAKIDDTGKLTFKSDTLENLANSELAITQNIIAAIFKSIKEEECGHYLPTLRPILERLASDSKRSLQLSDQAFELKDQQLNFTSVVHALENQASSDKQEAKAIIQGLRQYSAQTTRQFQQDAHLDQLKLELATANERAEKNIQIFREIIKERDALLADIEQADKAIEQCHAQLSELAAREPANSEAESRRLLANYLLTENQRTQMIAGLEQTQRKLHSEFRVMAEFDSVLALRDDLFQKVNALKVQLAQIIQHAHNQPHPLTKPDEAFAKAQREKAKLNTLISQLQNILRLLEEAYAETSNGFIEARQKLIQILEYSQTEHITGDLHQRLDATLANIEYFIQSYAAIPEFKDTQLDNVVTDYLDDARERTLATKQTLSPAFVPASRQSKVAEESTDPKHKKMSLASKVLIGAAVGALVVAAAAITVGIILLTHGAAAFAIAGFIAAVGAKLTIAGTVGAFLGIGAASTLFGAGAAGLIGSAQKSHQTNQKLLGAAPARSTSSTALLARHMRTKDLAIIEDVKEQAAPVERAIVVEPAEPEVEMAAVATNTRMTK